MITLLQHCRCFSLSSFSRWPPSSHDQIPLLFYTFEVNIYGVSTLVTAATQNEMHVISHSNTHIFS